MCVSGSSQPPDKPKLVGYAMKLHLVSLARLAGLMSGKVKDSRHTSDLNLTFKLMKTLTLPKD